MSNHLNSIRPKMFIGFLITVAMIAGALILQYMMELDPCPLCLTQRAIIIAIGFIFLVATIHDPTSWGRRIYAFLLALVSGIGITVAGRHVWLQHLPEDKIPECGPGLEFWINNLPLLDVVKKVFRGTGDCAEVLFTFIGLSIPEWTLIAFVLFLLFSIRLLFTTK